MRTDRPTFVFVHGYWHDSGTWDLILPSLAKRGFATRALDLPGAGANAKAPSSYFNRPLDAAAFSTEPSPNAGVAQEDRTRAVVDAIRSLDGPVILVGHSMGGATISDVAEIMPERIAAVVYVTAFMLPPGLPPIAMIQHETMTSALVPSLFLADPANVGALRIDPRSESSDYLSTLRAAFYADVAEEEVARLTARLHCDEPVSTALHPSAVTAGRFGTIERHYIRCSQDRAIPLTGQDHMIAAMDSAMNNPTTVHTLTASHSPFYSRSTELTDLLVTIAG